MPPAPRTRPYKDFLTPALHKRFITAAVSLLGLCYLEAILIGEWNSLLWSWFPFGMVGIRTGLLFISGFSIFVLRVAQVHVGTRTTDSAFQTFTQYIFRIQTVQTAGWYCFSAWLYSEIYIFSASRDTNIKWITESKINERPRLNERPIYLTSIFLLLALIQAGFHLYYDYDRVDIPVTKTKPEASSDQRVHLIVPPSAQLKTIFPTLVASALKRSLLIALVGPPIYSFTIRRLAWEWTLTFAKMIWSLPRSTALPIIPPFYVPFLFKSFTGSFLLIMMWEVGNAAFSAYSAQEPLKNERPFTYESRDPNGSLLTGLRGKRLLTRAFAFWELVYIAQHFQGRRKGIFEEIDRKGGSTWSQILEVCLGTINEINTRIAQHLAPPPPLAAAAKPEDEAGLPRLVASPREDDIWNAPALPKSRSVYVAQTIGSIAKSHGQSPQAERLANKLFDKAKATILTPKQREALSPNRVSAFLGPYALKFLQSPFGWPFRHEYRRRMAAVVLGSPYGDMGVIVNAIDALTRLVVSSLKEDSYGNVQRDVPNVIRTFTATIAKLEDFRRSLTSHWTDVEKKQESPEVDTILAALRGGLHELLASFGDYSEDLRLSPRDMREAREAATSVPFKAVEMKQK